MKEIKLTRGKVAFVDEEDYEYLNQWKWYALKNNKTYYAQRGMSIKGKDVVIKMHRFIMNTPKGMEIDHIDHNGLNNQKSNLRNVTPHQNRMNKNIYKNNKTGYKGVTIINGMYYSSIKANNKILSLGKYNSIKEAAVAYNEAAIKYFGEFARLNRIN